MIRTARRRATSLVIVLVASLAVTTAPVTPASAAPDALASYVLPGTDVYPFGVSVLGGEYYATGGINGALYHGDLRERRASVLIPPETAVPHGRNGIVATATRLIVTENGEGPPWVSIYQRLTGRLVARFTTGNVRSFLAFPGLAPNGDVYVVDFRLPRLYRIPAHAIAQQRTGVQSLPIYRSLRNTAIYDDPAGYGPTAVIATSDARFLLISNNPTGTLFRVRLSDRSVTPLNLHGALLTGAAGMVLTEADVLYVVRFTDNSLAEIRLGDEYRQGRLVSQTRDPRFRGPDGIAIAGDRLLISNSQFTGPGTPPWQVISLPLP
jgi:hypothetical protein